MKVFKWLFGGVEYVDYTVSTEERFSDTCLVISRTEKHYKTIFDYIFNNNNQYLYSEKVLFRSEVELKLPVFVRYYIENYLSKVLLTSVSIENIKILSDNSIKVDYYFLRAGGFKLGSTNIPVESFGRFGGFDMKYLRELVDEEPRSHNKF